MNKKIIGIICGTIIIIAGLVGGFFYYSYRTPSLELYVLEMGDINSEYYRENISLSIDEKFGFSLPEDIQEKCNEYQIATDVIRDEYFMFEGPMHIYAEIAIVDGQTIFTYSGTYTDENLETLDYNREVVLDFVLTKNIRE